MSQLKVVATFTGMFDRDMNAAVEDEILGWEEYIAEAIIDFVNDERVKLSVYVEEVPNVR